jgi:hypothetical protein
MYESETLDPFSLKDRLQVIHSTYAEMPYVKNDNDRVKQKSTK